MHDYDNVCFANIVQTHTEMVSLFFVLHFRDHRKLFCFFKQEVERIFVFLSQFLLYIIIYYMHHYFLSCIAVA